MKNVIFHYSLTHYSLKRNPSIDMKGYFHQNQLLACVYKRCALKALLNADLFRSSFYFIFLG